MAQYQTCSRLLWVVSRSVRNVLSAPTATNSSQPIQVPSERASP